MDGPDGLRICGLHPDLQLCQSRTEAVQQSNLFFPQNIGGNLEMKVGDTIVMFINILPDLHGMFMIAVKGTINKLHLFHVLIQEKLKFFLYDTDVT